MATLTTKFSVGDTVWYAGTTTEVRKHPCPDCKGEREWTAVSPAGSEYKFACPRCSATYQSDRDLSLTYTAHAAHVVKRTIGSVRVDTHKGTWGNEEHNSYMCLETGVGSGNIYRESDLFATEAEALAAAEAKATRANSTTEWIAKLYDKTLQLSDYQLENATLRSARDEKRNARSFLWNIGNLFAEIEEAADKDAILKAIADYKNLDWDNDKTEAEIAAQVPA